MVGTSLQLDTGLILSNKLEKYEIINSIPKIRKLANKMKRLDAFAYDTETNTLQVAGPNKEFRCAGISISWGVYNNYYIPLNHIFDGHQLLTKTVVKYLKPIFERTDIVLALANGKFDMHVLARLGIQIKTPYLFDIVIASWLHDENLLKGLKENTQRVLCVNQTHFKDALKTITKEEKKAVGLKASSKGNFTLTHYKVSAPYAVDDAFYTWQLYLYYIDVLIKDGMDKIYWKVYPAIIYTFYNMEEKGIDVDKKRLAKMGKAMQKDLDELEYKMTELAGVTMSFTSSQQLVQLLFGYDKFKTVYPNILQASFKFQPETLTKGGIPQANKEFLLHIVKKTYKTRRKREGIEFCKLLAQHKKLSKLKSAFVDGLLDKLYDDEKCHPAFNVVGTDSGRVSCSKPNLMQLPNAKDDDKYQIRDVFIGSINEETGEREDIISVDFSNLEIRVGTHFSKDKVLYKAFVEGHDIHGATAVTMLQLPCEPDEVKKKYPDYRQMAKKINFGLFYGMSAPTLCGQIEDAGVDMSNPKLLKKFNVKDKLELSQKLMDMYFEGYPGVAEFIKKQKKFAHKHGFVWHIDGRKRRLPNINSSNYKQLSYSERLSVNAPVQGGGASIMMNAQNKIDGTLKQAVNSKEICDKYNDKHFIGSNKLNELQCKMLLQVHDELIFSCPKENCDEAMAIIRDYMIHPFGNTVHLNVPLEVGMSHGRSYQTGH
jgi:DNA polymerase-1